MIRDRLQSTFREAHPEWTDAAVAQAVSHRMLGAADHELDALLDRVLEATQDE